MDTGKELLASIHEIHIGCMKICKLALGDYLEVAGNIGIFCRSDEEYQNFIKLSTTITEPSSNPLQKYYRLYEPIVITPEENIPETIYTYLYIRKPDPTPYGKYSGDVDFVLSQKEYIKLKNDVTKLLIKGAELYDRPNWDTIQLTNSTINAVAYVSTMEFAKKARVKFD